MIKEIQRRDSESVRKKENSKTLRLAKTVRDREAKKQGKPKRQVVSSAERRFPKEKLTPVPAVEAVPEVAEKPLADARKNLTSAATVTVIPGPAKKLIAGTNRD